MLYFEFETVLKFYNLGSGLVNLISQGAHLVFSISFEQIHNLSFTMFQMVLDEEHHLSLQNRVVIAQVIDHQ